jgi:hypothetical protein
MSEPTGIHVTVEPVSSTDRQQLKAAGHDEAEAQSVQVRIVGNVQPHELGNWLGAATVAVIEGSRMPDLAGGLRPLTEAERAACLSAIIAGLVNAVNTSMRCADQRGRGGTGRPS